jgi:two-component system invasion response regulator UvrY
MRKIVVGLVDDHKLFRDGMSSLISSFEDYLVSVEADNGMEFIQKLNPGNMPDIVLLDINMKEMDGYETARWIKENHPDIKILALSMYESENSIIRMLRLGARGYILKDIRKKELQEALQSLANKGYYYTEMVTGKLIHAINNLGEGETESSLKGVASLNTRELEFLKWACSELTYKEIAGHMNLSVHTIDGYRDALFEKLRVKTRVGLVLYAIRNKIVIVD